jgi:Divergent InlB B-repeat domain
MKWPLRLDMGTGRVAFLLSLCLLGWGCSSVTLTSTDAGPNLDAGPDGGNVAVILTISDYLNWCSVTVNGDGGYIPMAAFVVGSVVQLDASPKPAYVWGYWTGTDGDTGSGDTKMATTVTMDASKEVVACCPQAPPATQTCPRPIP